MRRTKVVLDFMTCPVVEKVPFYINIFIQLADTSLFANLATINVEQFNADIYVGSLPTVSESHSHNSTKNLNCG